MVVRQFAASLLSRSAPEPAYLTIHGHFYQPDRADPVTGRVPNEPGAGEYGNFNVTLALCLLLAGTEEKSR